MTTYVEIVVNVPQVTGTFHYHLPEVLENKIRVGHLVSVPFGRQTVQGIVTGYVEQPEVSKTRPVSELIDPAAILTPVQIQFARQLAKATLSSLGACISLMLPPGLAKNADVLYTAQTELYNNLTQTQNRFLKLLNKRGPLRGQQIDRSLSRMNWRAAARSLVRRGLVTTQSVLPSPKVRPKTVRTAQLACPPEVAETAMPTLAKGALTAELIVPTIEAGKRMDDLGKPGTKALDRRQVMLTYLMQNPGENPVSTLNKVSQGNRADLQKLVDLNLATVSESSSPVLKRRQAILRYLINEPEPVNAAWLYAESGGSLADLYVLADRGLVILGESEVWRDPVEQIHIPLSEPPPLTRDQQTAWNKVLRIFEDASAGEVVPPILLHGVTGSGKTEIYLKAVRKTIDLGKQAIVLVPEIALTPQTIRRFASRFPGQVGLIHSGLSQGERYDTWRRARAGEISVIVGPRSALFSPFDKLGLIVVDECHDDTYYQVDPEPRYHAREAAVAYTRIAGALCLMGSATPDIVSNYRAQTQDHGKQQYVHLSLPGRIIAHRDAIQAQLEKMTPKRRNQSSAGLRFHPLEGDADSAELPPVSVVDMRLELQSGNRSIFSRDLQNSLSRVLDAGEQAILFLNRRGTATYIFCRDCGNSLRCPRCDVPLTYHGHTEALICHRCGYKRRNPSTCPSCGSNRIRHYGTGTQRVESEVLAQFPKVRTLRWDYETTRKKGAHDTILSHFASHRADVLIGTQMLAKGLDLPLVTLVGVILADVGLNLPDYRASERTFQVLTQVAGRAGRSPLGGSVILQTFQPEHYVIEAASTHDYINFYERELIYRRQLGYPPFTRLVKLEYRDLKPERAEKTAQTMAAQIQEWIKEEGRRSIKVIGPVPCFFSRISGYYRWQIVLSGHDPTSLLRGRHLSDWKVFVNPPNLL